MTKRVKMEERVGQQYGRLLIESVYREGKRSYAVCSCSCGNQLVSRIDALQSEATVSCGCLAKENASLLNKSHGMWKSYTYQSWADMKARCLDEDHRHYDRYKDKNICEKWMTFEGFYEDMGERPKNTTLDRIDNEKGYTKENCRWANASYQARNQKKRNIDTSVSKFKGVGRDLRAKRTTGWFFTVTRDYKTARKYCSSEEQAAAYFNYGTALLYEESVTLNEVDYVMSDSEKSVVFNLVVKKFPELNLKEKHNE